MVPGRTLSPRRAAAAAAALDIVRTLRRAAPPGRPPTPAEGLNAWRRRPALKTLALTAMFAACWGSQAVADEAKVYEWREPNGVRSYAQNPPPPQARGVTSFEVDTRTFTPAQRAAVRARLARIDAAEDADSARFQARVAAADVAVNQALHSLSQAERAGREGRAPLPGESVGNAGGFVRLRVDYFDRQKRLEDAIRQARVAVDDAYRERGQLTP
jgi:hypothetical protein